MRSFGFLRALDEGASTVDAVISTGDIARDDAIIDPAGWDFTNYRRNPVVLFNHNDYSAMPVARTVEGPSPAGAELVARAEFDTEDPDAMRLFSKIRRGFINATSVRWLPKRWEFVKVPSADAPERTVLVFREQELLEWSFVNIPADPGAVILRADGEGIDLSIFNPPVPSSQDEEEEPEEPEASQEEQEERHNALSPRLEAVIGRLEALADARANPPNVAELIVRGLAKATGKSEDRIRREMAAGGFK